MNEFSCFLVAQLRFRDTSLCKNEFPLWRNIFGTKPSLGIKTHVRQVFEITGLGYHGFVNFALLFFFA